MMITNKNIDYFIHKNLSEIFKVTLFDYMQRINDRYGDNNYFLQQPL